MSNSNPLRGDKFNLDIVWLKDKSLEDSDNLPSPEIIAREIVENLESAVEEFGEIQEFESKITIIITFLFLVKLFSNYMGIVYTFILNLYKHFCSNLYRFSIM